MVRKCPRCGTPRRVTKEHEWLDNGVIQVKRKPFHRMLFFERDNVKALFENIEETLGRSVERIIVESQRRNAYEYLSSFIPKIPRSVLKAGALKYFVRRVSSMGTLLGLGYLNPITISVRDKEDDNIVLAVKNPWFIPSLCGVVAGGLEAVIRKECSVAYTEKEEDECLINAFISKHEVGLEERLRIKSYPIKSGNIEMNRCSQCKGPMQLSRYRWDPVRGVIENKASGRRMVIFVPQVFEAIFEELENELGEHISEVIIDAQSSFVKTGFYSIDELENEGNLRNQFALRGLGNLKEMSFGKEGMSMRVENPAMPLMIVGFSLGIYELAFGMEPEVDWERSDDGDLVLKVSPK